MAVKFEKFIRDMNALCDEYSEAEMKKTRTQMESIRMKLERRYGRRCGVTFENNCEKTKFACEVQGDFTVKEVVSRTERPKRLFGGLTILDAVVILENREMGLTNITCRCNAPKIAKHLDLNRTVRVKGILSGNAILGERGILWMNMKFEGGSNIRMI